MEFFGVTINFDYQTLLALADDPWSAAWLLVRTGGWIVPLWLFLWMGFKIWMNYITNRHVARKLKPVILAVDVPKLGIQTPKAVENIFAHLAGAHGSSTRRETYITGSQQEWFSLEIVSIEGYIQFLIWTWDKYRDLVETAIYAQYPDAQITEVEDYTTTVPVNYPNEEWDLFGTEFIQTKPSAYPIRTWDQFEHKGAEDEPFKDPLAALLENMARIGPGEQIWLQILIMPIGQEWQQESIKVVKKLIGAKVTPKKTAIDTAFEVVGTITSPLVEQLIGPSVPTQKKDEPPSKVLFMAPGERAVVELIEKKSAKIGFFTKIRLVYVARKEVFKKPRGAHAVIGAIKQFNTNDANSLKPEYKHIGPSSLFLFKNLRNDERKRKVIRAYKKRSMWMGMPKYVMNIEELATLWHFPTVAVHTPLVRKIEAKRAEPPSSLPVVGGPPAPTFTVKGSGLPAVGPPEGLPIVK